MSVARGAVVVCCSRSRFAIRARALFVVHDCTRGAGMAAGIASGDLPVDTIILQEQSPCSGGTDEGRAMAELVHDLAPGASIRFCSGLILAS